MDYEKSNLLAYLDDYHLISAYVSKYYYNGVSPVFRLRDIRQGKLWDLTISSSYDDRQKGYTCYKLRVDEALEIGAEYDLVDAYGLSCPLVFGRVVFSKDFDTHYSCLEAELGSIYTKESTTFRVWAPMATKCKVEYVLNNRSETVRMQRVERGIYEVEVKGDLEGASYIYLIRNHTDWQQATDPYAYGSTANAKRSVVIDLDKIQHDNKKSCLKPLEKYTDAIIYEASVRDFTWMAEVGFKNRGKFLGMVEEGVTLPNGSKVGLDYLKDLGVTHIQLLPIFDFATVDEEHQEVYYNWGYDPIQYNVPEGSYATKPNDGYNRILELKEMISKFHENGLRVIMDVVYNHMHNWNTTPFERIVPGYFFRRGNGGELSNGSFCGNDLATQRPMVRKFVVESCVRWVKEYGIDGFRFDLMGIIDINTMNEIVEKCLEIDPNLMFYGEGWNMPTLMDDKNKSMIGNHLKLNKVGFFNDHFRTIVRGPNGTEQLHQKGYCGGNTYLTHSMATAMLGCDYLSDPWRSINYIECHDNETFWDKLKVSNLADSKEKLEDRMKLANAAVILSEGIPFIHSGQEFCRTKNGEHNTYNRPDAINQLNWFRSEHHKEQVSFMKDMITIRKENPCFRFSTSEEVRKHCTIEETDYRMITVTYDHLEGPYEQIKLMMNPSEKNYQVDLAKGTYILLGDLRGKVDELLKTNNILVTPASLMIVAKKKVQ